jgi:hypothetical protein
MPAYTEEGWSRCEVDFMEETGCTEAVLKVLRSCLDHEECHADVTIGNIGLSYSGARSACKWLESKELAEITSSSNHRIVMHLSEGLCSLLDSWDVYSEMLFFPKIAINKLLRIPRNVLVSRRVMDMAECRCGLYNIRDVGRLMNMGREVEALLEELHTSKWDSETEALHTGPRVLDYQRSWQAALTDGRPKHLLPFLKNCGMSPFLKLKVEHFVKHQPDERLPQSLLFEIEKECGNGNTPQAIR